MQEEFKKLRSNNFSKYIFFIIKTLLSFGIIVFLIGRLNLKELNVDYFKTDYTSLVLSVMMFLIAFVLIQSTRLYVLLNDRSFSFFSILKLTLVSIFVSSFLPSTIGGDSVKIYYLKKNTNSGWTRPVTLVFLERFSGLFVLMLFGLIYSCIYFDFIIGTIKKLSIDIHFNIKIVILLISIIAIGIGIYFIYFSNKIGLIYKKIVEFIKSGVKIITETPKRIFIKLIILSIIFHFFRLIGFYLVISYVNETIFWFDLFFVLFFTAIISVIPVSIGGLGLREGAITMSLMLFNISANSTIMVALFTRIIIVVLSIVGAIIYIQSNFKKKKI